MNSEKITYGGEISKAMKMLSEDPRSIFIGQTVEYGGSRFTKDLEKIPSHKKLEMPVSEEMQLGISTGMALEGYLPICIYPRFDFMLLATNQLVNHLDKIELLSQGEFKPKVIIRAIVGGTDPYPGPQHCQDYTDEFKSMLDNVYVKRLESTDEIVDEYRQAMTRDISSLLVDLGDLYLRE